MAEEARVLVVGELNPYGADPRTALYHLPRGASGDRLRNILGLSDVAYSRRLARVNLCTGNWSTSLAREMARYLRETDIREVFVLLGSRVREAFRGPSFFEVDVQLAKVCSVCGHEQLDTPSGATCYLGHGGAEAEVKKRVLLGLPHPSGRNLLWNDLANRQRAAEALQKAAPWVYQDEGART